MLYVDYAGVASKSPHQFRKIMVRIGIVCVVFDLTVSGDNKEIMYFRVRGL